MKRPKKEVGMGNEVDYPQYMQTSPHPKEVQLELFHHRVLPFSKLNPSGGQEGPNPGSCPPDSFCFLLEFMFLFL